MGDPAVALRMSALATAMDAMVGQLTERKVTQLLVLTLLHGVDDPEIKAAILVFEQDRHCDTQAAGLALSDAVRAGTAEGVETDAHATEVMHEYAWQRRVDING